MKSIIEQLDHLAKADRKFLEKGGLSVGLVGTRKAMDEGLPIPLDSLSTKGGGQVSGMGKSAVQKILAAY